MPFLDPLKSQSEDPLVSFNFAIEVQDQVTGFFTEVSGLGSETEVTEHKVMGPKGQQIVKQVAGRLKWEQIVLKRGITANMDIWDWRKMVEDGQLEEARRNGSIVMYDQTGGEVARWNFERAWPSKVTGPQPKADSGDIGIEEMTIVHEYVKRVK
jgi:phage tail-like protein